MKVNQNIALRGEKVVLVPYREEHVQTYHRWMTDPELRELTASEALSLEEEYDMQRKWQEDEDKLTFIILAREQAPNPPSDSDAQKRADDAKFKTDTETDMDRLMNAIGEGSESRYRMIGDVNLFLKGSLSVPRPDGEDDGRGGEKDGEDDDDAEAEVEIMIAEPGYRRQGYASEALQLFLSFATTYTQVQSDLNAPLPPLPPSHTSPPQEDTKLSYVDGENDPGPATGTGMNTRNDRESQSITTHTPRSKFGLTVPLTSLVVRIGESNTPSIALFERLGFVVVKRVAVFQEVEMRLSQWKAGKERDVRDGNEHEAVPSNVNVGHERWCRGEMVVFE